MPDGNRGDPSTPDMMALAYLRKQRRGGLPPVSQATMRLEGNPRSPAALGDPTVYGTRRTPTPPRHPRGPHADLGRPAGADMQARAAVASPLLAAHARERVMTN